MSERNLAIFNDYKELGTLQLVGNKYGITRERVRQIVKKFGYKKPKKYAKSKEEKEEERRARFIESFWHRMEIKDSGCWEWTRSRLPFGYGHMMYKGKSTSSHRVAWIITYGEIPDGLCVCHKCDNPPCINPDHLFLGTVADNMHDRDKKGRGRGKKTHA